MTRQKARLTTKPILKPVGLIRYQKSAARRDQNKTRGIKGLTLPLYGLFGESGGLLTVIKKKKREERAYTHYKTNAQEELGDALWYLSNISTRTDNNLKHLARLAMDASSSSIKANIKCDSFSELQKIISRYSRKKINLDTALLYLAADVGALVKNSHNKHFFQKSKECPQLLSQILLSMVFVANAANLSLNDAAYLNLQKTGSRWPQRHSYRPLFDKDEIVEERLPRVLRIHFKEHKIKGKVFVTQRIGNLNIGDRLTDNIDGDDDYRFHDVFHWSYVAILGWSPVTRGLLKCKRKSKPKIDENEDGARASIIEEAVSVWIFHQAKGRGFFRTLEKLDYSLLKAVKDLVAGYEVYDVPLWQWEKAILDGYRVFRELRKNRKGWVIVDMHNRSITFKKS